MSPVFHPSYVRRVSSANCKAVLRVWGPDKRGIVAEFSHFLHRHGCGIISSEHYTDQTSKTFFQRILFDYECGQIDRSRVQSQMQMLGESLSMHADLHWSDHRQRVAIMVSKYDHCLWELLLRHRSKELDCDIPLVLSNHPELRSVADTFRIPFEVFPITPGTKHQQENKELQLLQSHNVDVVVLARYMQILTADFLQAYPDKIINIHHSFLPAFSGEKAYRQAHERGVKLIGATAHYVTEDLDQGPIIEQDVTHVSHRDSHNKFVHKGQILERNVLVRALQAHLDHRVIVHNNKCVVFTD